MNKSIFVEDNNINILFTTIIVLFPVLSLYGVGLGTFTLGDFLLCCILIIEFVFNHKRKTKFSLPFLIFSLYILLQLIINFIFTELESGELLRTLRYLFYVIVIALCIPNYFNQIYASKLCVIFSIISIIMIIIQTFSFVVLGKYIPGYIPGLPILREELISFSEKGVTDSLGLLRPRSFFGEPAHYAQYILLGLTIILFNKRTHKPLLILFFIIGVLLSVSSTGILCLLFLLAVYGINNLRNIVKYIPLIIIALIGLYFSVYFQGFLTRINNGKSTEDRFSGYEILFQDETSYPNILFGKGMIEIDIDKMGYLAGYPRLILYFGIVGTVLFLFSLFYKYKNKSQFGKILIILFAILNFGTEVALGPFLILYIGYIIKDYESRYIYSKL